MEWFEELPPSCPPSDATDCKGTYYRVSHGNPAESHDFFSQKLLAPDKQFKGEGIDYRIMNKKQSILKVDSILEYYDNPQLLTARDCFDTLYLCLLYEDFPQCKYTAIKISSKKLNDFYKGKKDLRSLFLTPEDNKEYFYVTYDDHKFFLHQEAAHDISEDKLPAEGYFLDKSGKESIIVNIPTKDKGLFTELVKKFGWACM